MKKNQRKEHTKQYAKRSCVAIDEAGGYYSRHIMAMTREDLHNKAEIACELAWRDMRIDELERTLQNENV